MGVPPDDFVTGPAHGGPAAVLGGVLGGLQDGAAVLHGRGLHGLPVLRHDRGRLVRPVAVGKARVGDPGRAARRARAVGSRLAHGSWGPRERERERERERVNHRGRSIRRKRPPLIQTEREKHFLFLLCGNDYRSYRCVV